jgi:cell division protein FtsL
LTDNHISQEDLALHALQALSEGESAAVRAHLVQCALCRDELAEFSGDAAMIGLSVSQHSAPAGARQRLLNRIAADASVAKQSVQQEKRKRVLPIPNKAWIPWVTAAALAILAISLFVTNIELNKELADASSKVTDLRNQSAQARQVLDLLTSHSAQRVLLTASKASVEPTGRAVYLADSGSLVFQANNLKLLASDKTYELWVIPVNGNPIPAGLFQPDATGNASVVLPPLPKGIPAKAFGVTIEKAEGSDAPTAPILISGATASTGE